MSASLLEQEVAYSPVNASRTASDTGKEIALSVVRVTSVPDPEARWAPAIGSTPR